MKRWAKEKKGFTIVELLIVIVVIGILAAITIVAYSGIQQRAKNEQMVSGMTHYVKTLAAYTTDKNVYPIPNGFIACFGAQNNCHGSANAAQTTALATELSPYMNGASQTLLSNEGALINYITNSPMPDGSNFTGMYVYFIQQGTITTCPAIGGTRFMSLSPSGSNTICRLTLPVVS